MMVEIKIKAIEIDPNSLYRTQKIRISSDKHITTPTKTIPLDKIKLKDNLNSKSKQVNEIFNRFNSEKIRKANEDTDEYHSLEVWFNRQKSKISEGTITFCFLDFDEKRIPTEEEIEFMVDTAYSNSDITSIPTISHFNTPKQEEISYEDYKKYIDKAIETIQQLNNKPIMGIIPKLAPKKIADLLEFYKKHGINSFALDLAGQNPISYSMRIFRVLKKLNKMEALESSYIHGHNLGMRVNKITEIIPAKDILGFGVGLNSLGEKRRKFKPNKAFLDYIKINPLNKYRLFNKKDYGYWKSVSTSEITEILPEDSRLDIASFKNNNQEERRHLQNVFNTEQLALESHHIRDVINENPEESLAYVKKKKHVAENDIKLLEKCNKKISK